MSGCTAVARLYPVQGPLSAQTPQPVFTGKINGFIKSGNVSFVIAGGESFKGQWTRVDSPAAGDMQAAWDTVYGAGYYVAHVLGTGFYGRSKITGSLGTVLAVEFYQINPAPGRVHVIGVAKDSHGNIFKMAFPSN